MNSENNILDTPGYPWLTTELIVVNLGGLILTETVLIS